MGRGYNENNRLYTRMNEIKLGDWEILPLLSRTCDIKTIRDVEKHWIRILSAGLNSYSPVTDQKEYNAAYYKNNKEKLLQRNAEYRKNNKGKIKMYYGNNKETRRYYCGLCNVVCMQNSDLKKHLNTLKHTYAWLNSVD